MPIVHMQATNEKFARGERRSSGCLNLVLHLRRLYRPKLKMSRTDTPPGVVDIHSSIFQQVQHVVFLSPALLYLPGLHIIPMHGPSSSLFSTHVVHLCYPQAGDSLARSPVTWTQGGSPCRNCSQNTRLPGRASSCCEIRAISRTH